LGGISVALIASKDIMGAYFVSSWYIREKDSKRIFFERKTG
jgi:hypothetical protein